MAAEGWGARLLDLQGSDGHWVSANPQRVYHHTSVLLVQEEPNCRRLFHEVLPNWEKTSLSWAQFKRLSKMVGLPDGLSENTIRSLPDKTSDDLNHYWEKVRGNQ